MGHNLHNPDSEFASPDAVVCTRQCSIGQWAALWLALRIVVSPLAAWISALRPLTHLEQTLGIWPPSVPLGQWFYRIFLAPWERWDVVWYLRILTEGYRAGNGTDAFHPLYPWLAFPLTLLGLDPLLSLMLVTFIALIAFAFVYARLAALDLSWPEVSVAGQLLLFFPIAFVFLAPYNESLFFLLSALVLWWSRKHQWWLAGAAGALAVLTRQQGLFLMLPMAWELWEYCDRRIRHLLCEWRDALAIGLMPLALLFWALYRVLIVGGNQLDFRSPFTLLYSLMISPSAGQVGAAHILTWPWHTMVLALKRLWLAPDVDLIVNLVLGIAFLAAFVLAWHRLRMSYRLYVLVVVLVSFSYHTGMVHPYMGLPRHLFLAFPVFIGLAPLIRRSWQRLALVGSGFLSICFLSLLYVFESWVP